MVCLATTGAWGAAPVPHDLQAALLVKVLDYDRSLVERVPGDLPILLVWEESRSRSRADCRAMAKALAPMEGKPVRGKRVRVERWQLPSDVAGAELERRLRGAGAVYLCRGTTQAKRVVRAAMSVGVLSVEADREAVERGAMIGFGIKENRPRLFVNIASIKTAKIRLDPRLLVIADRL